MKTYLHKFLMILVIVMAVGFGNVDKSFAICKDNFINPITDVDWYAMFPIKLGGVALVNSRGVHTPPDSVGNPICVCNSQTGGKGSVGIGLKISMWEPFYIIEIVKDPWCSPTLGIQLDHTQTAQHGDQMNMSNGADVFFAEAHGVSFPVFAIMNIFIDLPCLAVNDPTNSGGQTGLASTIGKVGGLALNFPYPTEVMPFWNSSTAGFLSHPSSLLFANPITQLACIADSIASNIATPLDGLFWCEGSWGTVYPENGHTTKDAYLDSVTGLVGRALATIANAFLLNDRGVDYCYSQLLPIWVKSHYRVQEFRPVVSSKILTIGESSMLWGTLQSPTVTAGSNSPDNFAFVITRYDKCCSDTIQ